MTYAIAFNRQSFSTKPTAHDWATFNKNFKNVELGMMDIMNAIYLGHPYCAQMDGNRCSENFIKAQHIAVDLDAGDYECSIDALSEHPLVLRYGAIVHETPSHSDIEPRSRVIFLLDSPITTATGYKVAVETITQAFPDADPSCVDSARFFYGAGHLRTQGREDGIWWSEKEPLLPVAAIRSMYRNQQVPETVGLPTTVGGKLGGSLGAKVCTTSPQDEPLEVVMAKLQRVDPWQLDYVTWFKCIAGLKHHYGDSAYSAAMKWSHRPDKPDITMKKWESISNQSSRPATIATVYRVIGDTYAH